MVLKKYEDLPKEFICDEVLEYYNILAKKNFSLIAKRILDIVMSLILLLLCTPIILVISIIIKVDSQGPVVFKQERVTTYGKKFWIYKFRTMFTGSEKGSQVTVDNDTRITKVGKVLRKYRLDELLQLINILKGDMSFVGTRPEVQKYVDEYSNEMYATLLMPAGVTSLASIRYKDEDRLLQQSKDTDYTYISEILPEKMKYNLEYILKFSILYDISLMFLTVFAVFKKEDTLVNEQKDKELLNRQ